LTWKSVENLLLASFLLSLAAWIGFCFWFPLTDTDIWWHLASARWMVEHRSFLFVDPFCLASLGQPWTDLHWGFQLAVYTLWTIGGAWLLILVKVLCMVSMVGLVFWSQWQKRSIAYLTPVAALGAYPIRLLVDVRPLMFTLVLLALQYALVMGYFRSRQIRWLVFLLPCQCLLVNIQGLYLLGPFLVSCFAVQEWVQNRRHKGKTSWTPLMGMALVLGFMGFASPYGWKGFALPFALFGRIAPVPGNIFSAEIAENQPLLSLFRQDPYAVLPLFLGFILVLYSFDKNRRAFSLGHALIFAAFTALGVMAQRNLPIAFLGGLMAIAYNLRHIHSADQQVMPSPAATHPRPPLRITSASRSWLLGGLALAAIDGIYAPSILHAWRFELPGSLVTPFRFPENAVQFLRRNPIPGQVFNELRYGGYMDYALFPDKLTFIDGRMILRDAGFYRRFLRAVDEPEYFRDYRQTYGITHAVLPISEDKRFLPLAAWLIRSGHWSLLFCDGAGVVLASEEIRPDLALTLKHFPEDHPILIEIKRRFGSHPELLRIATGNAEEFLAMALGKPVDLDEAGEEVSGSGTKSR